ncbi:MAG: TRAP transporter substrate-binding protein DctP [Nitrospirae bacterium]|nr:TRAP transporter substrate-binding protein DctP [Nitrospirota bacterium]
MPSAFRQRSNSRRHTVLGLFITLILCTVLGFAPIPASADPIKLRGSILTPEGSRWTEEVKSAIHKIKSATGGRVDETLYTAGVQGEESEVVEKLKKGDLDIAALSDLGLAYIVPDMQILNLPFFIKNEKESAFLEGKLHDRFVREFRERGFELLFWSPVGPGYLHFDRPIRNVEDMKGVRTWQWKDDPVGKVMIKELPGLIAVPLPLAEVRSALEEDRVDAVYNVPLATVAFQWHPFLKYVLDVPAVVAGGGTVIAHHAWNKISPGDRAIMAEISRNQIVSFRAGIAADSTAAIRGLKKYGVIFEPPSPEALAILENASDRIRKQLAGTLFSKEILAEAERLLAEYRKGLKQ